MAAPRPKKRALSDRLKGMRFMKRREETDLREKLLQEQNQRRTEAHWTVEATDHTVKTTPTVLIEDGVTQGHNESRIGRQSFGKFNSVFEAEQIESHETRTEARFGQGRRNDVKNSAEEPASFAKGSTRKQHSDPESHPLGYRKVDLRGATKVIAKKRKKGSGDRRSNVNPG